MPCRVLKVNPDIQLLSQGDMMGYDWIVTHNGSGFRCGYIKVPFGHPWHGEDWETINCNVHGGLTYAQPDTEDNSWWIGFDCAHYGDALDPTLNSSSFPLFRRLGGEGIIRTTEYVMSECHQLCRQAALAIA